MCKYSAGHLNSPNNLQGRDTAEIKIVDSGTVIQLFKITQVVTGSEPLKYAVILKLLLFATSCFSKPLILKSGQDHYSHSFDFLPILPFCSFYSISKLRLTLPEVELK